MTENDIPTTSVYFQWTLVRPDPGPYKPYSPEFTPVNLKVEVKVPNELIVSKTDAEIVLSPGGMAYAIMKLSRAIGKVQNGENKQ